MTGRRRWSTDDLDRVESMRREGRTWDEVGSAFGVNPDTARVAFRDSPVRVSPSARTHPGTVEPPTVAPIARPRAAQGSDGGIQRGSDLEPLVILSDVHAPYEDRRALALVCDVIRWLRPTRTIQVGDFADLHNVSRHTKDPAMRMSLAAELAGGRRVRQQIDDACDDARCGVKVVTMGNHEDRLRRYIAEHASALEGVVPSIDSLLEFPQHGWDVVEYGDVYRVGDLAITHDLDRAGKYAHEHSRVDMGGSTVIGHTHRMALTCAGTVLAGRHVAAMFGWLGDERFARYFKTPLRAHWQLGFGVGWLDHRTGYVTLQPVPIIGYRAVVAGKVFDAPNVAQREAA